MRITSRAKAQHLRDETVAEQGAGVEDENERRLRRSFVFFGALAAATLIPGTSRAQAPSRKRRPIEKEPIDDAPAIAPREGVAAFAEWDSPLSRLVRRVTLGITKAEVARANQLGWQGYLNYQLNYTRINDDAAEAFVATKYPLLSQTSDQLFSAPVGDLRTQLTEGTIYR
ncbi:MAG TPA: hypothetical protein VKP00_09050, partial [Gemmatimonadaceae bacterium]|nr:hypothetical protein [Gemmatimonadaceae bacterium]